MENKKNWQKHTMPRNLQKVLMQQSKKLTLLNYSVLTSQNVTVLQCYS